MLQGINLWGATSGASLAIKKNAKYYIFGGKNVATFPTLTSTAAQ